jgi:hypothetical protein
MSGRKHTLMQYTTLSGGTMSTGTGTLYSASTNIRFLDDIVIYFSWTGTPTGSMGIQVSPDNVNWYDLALTPSPAASGSAGNARVMMTQLPDEYIRAKYVPASGTGSLTVIIAGKMI